MPTAALLELIAGHDPGTRAFDGADLSAATLGDSVRSMSWWDPGRAGARLARLDLSGASLRGANLSNADLSNADLSEAACSDIVLRHAQLEQANLAGADLVNSNLSQADAGQAHFTGCLLEDANFAEARLRFADLTNAVMDGADFSGADLWGAKLAGVDAVGTRFRATRLDEAGLQKADLSGADLTGASLRRADLTGADLRRANMRDAVLDGANLEGADLRGAIMPHVNLSSCNLVHAKFAGTWLERTRLRAHQLGGAIGEEVAGEFEPAREGYISLEQNFRSLGNADDASWAFRRRRRMGKRLHRQHAATAWRDRAWGSAASAALQYLADVVAECICDYGESTNRVLLTLLATLVVFAAIYGLTDSLVARTETAGGFHFKLVDYLLFSLDSMTTVGTSEVGLRPGTQLGVLLSSIETVVGTILLGLLGFVLGARMRR